MYALITPEIKAQHFVKGRDIALMLLRARTVLSALHWEGVSHKLMEAGPADKHNDKCT